MSTLVSVLPVFLKDRDFPEGTVSPMDICRSVIRVINSSKLDGVQKLGNLWKIYPKDNESRLQLCVKQTIRVNGKEVKLYDENPNENSQRRSNEGARVKNDKLTIKNLPFEVTNEEVAGMLIDNKVILASTVRHGFLRDDLAQDELTSYKSGDRFVYVQPFDPPLPRKQQVGQFHCVVIHHGKMWPCKACNQTGHKLGDDKCDAKPKQQIISFRGYQNPLSNHFPNNIDIFENRFHSVEQAFLWRMATDFDKDDVAQSILQSEHAGEAKKLSSSIAANEDRWKWEQENIELMEELLYAKAAQCPQFRQTLLEYQNNTLADASPSLIWGTGLSPFVTEYTSPEYWPGKNNLGALLMELTQRLVQQDASTEPSAESIESASSDEHNVLLDDNATSVDDTAVTDAAVKEVDRNHHTMPIQKRDKSDKTSTPPTSQIAPDTPTDGCKTPKPRARPAERTPHQQRAARSLSSTTNRKGKQLDIKTAFSGATKSKRKTFASSPDQTVDNQGKLHKASTDVT
jgi:ribA/ribD-fused uncharacterized protein